MKKLLFIVTAIVLLAAVFAIPAFATGGIAAVTGPSSVTPGSTIEFTVAISGADAVLAAMVTPTFDTDVFELVSGSFLRQGVMTDFSGGDGVIAWDTPTDINGVLLKFTLRAKETAKVGSTYAVDCRYSLSNADDVVELGNTTGTLVTIAPDMTEERFSVTGQVTSFGPSGNAVIIKLMQDDAEIASTSTTNGTYAFTSVVPGAYRLVVEKQKHITAIYEVVIVDADITQNVAIYLFGDATGDGVIDGMDVIRLKKYLANYNYETGTSTVEISAGADATGDGVIDGMDVIRLKKYLANYNYETGTSTIPLGPQ